MRSPSIVTESSNDGVGKADRVLSPQAAPKASPSSALNGSSMNSVEQAVELQDVNLGEQCSSLGADVSSSSGRGRVKY